MAPNPRDPANDAAQALLPPFALDCGDWIAVEPEEVGIDEDSLDSPCLAVLSTVVIGADDFHSARGVILLGVLDGSPLHVSPVEGSALAFELIEEPDAPSDRTYRRFVLPAPTGELALLAEFDLSSDEPELVRRVEDLIGSFAWQGKNAA